MIHNEKIDHVNEIVGSLSRVTGRVIMPFGKTIFLVKPISGVS